MGYLILAILLATAIFAGFRVFPKWGADTFQVIVINYAVAAGLGGGWQVAGLRSSELGAIHGCTRRWWWVRCSCICST